MSVKDKGVSIGLGLVFAIIGSVASYYTGKADAQTERAVLKNEVKHLKVRVLLLESTKPELVAYRVNELTKKVESIQSGQATIIQLLNEITNHTPD